MFLKYDSDFHEPLYFWNMVEFELIDHDLDDNGFKKILFDLLLNLDGLNEMLFSNMCWWLRIENVFLTMFGFEL